MAVAPRPPLTVMDRVLAVASPRRAVRRAQNRAAGMRSSFFGFGMFRGPGQYDGARSSRRALRAWTPLPQSADDDTVGDLPALRARTRDLQRNAPLAAGATSTVTTSVIGSGLKMQSQVDRDVLQLEPEQASEWQRNTERLFRVWQNQCDVERIQPFGGIQDLAFRSMLESGDVFVLRRFVERPGELFGTRLQVIEADRVATPPERSSDPFTVDGVQRSEDTGEPIAYWIANQYPFGSSSFTQRSPLRFNAVAAFMPGSAERQTLHLYRRLRPGLTRGVPYLAPVVETIKQIDRYSEAEIMAAIVGGMHALVIQTEQAEGLANAAADPTVGIDSPKVGNQEVALDYGAVLQLMPGESAHQMGMNRPNTAFDPFVQALLRQVGVALELPFELLVKHFTASYSASRAAILEAWRFYMGRRDYMAQAFCQPSYEWFLTEAVARGLIEAPGFMESPIRRAAWAQARWTGRPAGTLDPTKETRAALERVYGNVATLAEVTTELTGGDWETNVDQRARELEAMNAAGVPVGTAYGMAPEVEAGEPVPASGGSDAGT